MTIPLETPFESQAFLNSPKNDSTVFRSVSLKRYGFMILYMVLISLAVRAAIFPLYLREQL